MKEQIFHKLTHNHIHQLHQLKMSDTLKFPLYNSKTDFISNHTNVFLVPVIKYSIKKLIDKTFQ